MTSVDEFLGGRGAPGAKFPAKGSRCKGTILDVEVSQQRQYDPGNPGGGELLWWSDKNKPTTENTGRPVEQLVVTIQTDLRDSDIDDDDGRRRMYFSGSKKRETTSLGSLVAAMAKAKARKLEVGGTIERVRMDGEGVTGDPIQWATRYEAPAPKTTDDFDPFGDGPEEPF